MGQITRARVIDLFGRVREKRIAVGGDIMIDHDVWGVEESSHEAPGWKFFVTHEERHLGGAANVARQVAALGGNSFLIGVVGDDEEARQVRKLLLAAEIEPLIVIDLLRPTTVKRRYRVGERTVLRADSELRQTVSGAVAERIKDEFLLALTKTPALIISDYQKGVVTSGEQGTYAHAMKLARERGVPVYVDPKPLRERRVDFYCGTTVITPNLKEAGQLLGYELTSTNLAEAGNKLLLATGAEAVLVTQAGDGMTLFTLGQPGIHIPSAAREVKDPVGAGDTVIATMALMRAAGATYFEAAQIASAAAAVVVGEVGTAAASQHQILKYF